MRKRHANPRMVEKIQKGECIDVSGCIRDGDYYVLKAFREGLDYCDAKNAAWVWSIGRRLSDGTIHASLRGDLYQNPNYDCLWLR